MLDGLDDVDWSALRDAYGPATEVRELLRDIGAGGNAWFDLSSSIFHQGTVYSATVAAVPFLMEIAAGRPDQRGDTVRYVGMLGDPKMANGKSAAAVRAAVLGWRDQFAAYLTDDDADVRTAAAYSFAVVDGDPGPLWARWSVERDADARAGLLLALGLRDPDRFVEIARHAVLHEEPPVRLAAALALTRAGSGLPDGGVEAVITALESGVGVPLGLHAGEPTHLVRAADDVTAAALVGRMCRSSRESVRVDGVFAAIERMEQLRSAVPDLLPLVASLLEDPAEKVRRWAVSALRSAGPAAAAYTEELARIAAGFPETAGEVGFTPTFHATEVLMRLGDPRWVDPVATAITAGDGRIRPAALVRWSPAVGDAIRPHLAGPALRFFAGQIRFWAGGAAPLAPDLAALLPEPLAAVSIWRIERDAPGGAARSGRDDSALIEGLRALPDEIDAAQGVWRLAGDAGPIVAVLRRVLAEGIHGPMPDLTGPGEDLRPLLEDATALLSGTAAATSPDRGAQVLAALILWRATGSAVDATETLEAILRQGDVPAYRAATLVADLADTFDPAAPPLLPVLRQRLADPWARVAAARALWRLGEPVDELVAPVLASISNGLASRHALSLLLEMGATSAIPALRELAERHTRLPVMTAADDVAWADEAARVELRTAIEALEASARR